ncbi:SRPBCC family protein [Propionivibrio sp.]|uniref:SRPBCC family protein n=1 Tax=Propionivibrio sp. TaxID=2212460 RepID=UPI0025D9F4C8|nr:SRPBCC family protein [Propionivibrio sp.]MBK7356107.1 SRPBCC family protein [Propionivibrio sp.]MBK8400225.1 SRPBCC family protein [Propionivibrio sp.]MBK8744067.1 SRPBCC family protein [Propionivibrio sp.]MBK8893701.1 SRPBCC family protein [Propionivibrio sp.]MBL0207247.1 SRPBCC family protein [Propionivibrio sp.]
MPALIRTLAKLTAYVMVFFSCAVAAVEQDIVINIEKSGEAFIVETRFDVQVPLRTAWDVLTDFDHMTGILGNLSSSRIVRRDGNTLYVAQEGVARFGIFSYAFASEREIRLEPMKRILAKQLTGNAKRFESELQLTSEGTATQVHYRAEVVPDSGFARTFGGSFIKHEVGEQFTAMTAEMMRRKSP